MRLMRNRRAAILGATVGAVVCAALLAVIALGAGALAPTQQIPPASQTWNVMPIDWPTGGQSNDCALFATDPQTVPAPYQFRIDNPQTLPNGYTTTAPDGTTVNFKLTIATNGPKKDKYFDWTATGANVWDVGVKGGSDTARYSYASPIPGWAGATNGGAPVYGDTAVHGTLDNQGKLYNLSNVTFCYSTTPSISGTVFDDANGDGTKGTATAEPGLAGRTVRLYSGTAAAVATTTDSGGKYVFAASQLTINASYRVCLVAVSDRSQTLPKSTTSGNSACTTSSNERPLGYGGSTLRPWPFWPRFRRGTHLHSRRYRLQRYERRRGEGCRRGRAVREDGQALRGRNVHGQSADGFGRRLLVPRSGTWLDIQALPRSGDRLCADAAEEHDERKYPLHRH